MKLRPLLVTPVELVTTMFPGVAFAGTVTVMLPGDQIGETTSVPLKVTVPVVDPNPDPEIVTVEPIWPDVTDRPVSSGPAMKVNALGFEAVPLAVTTTFPDEAPTGG